MLLEVVLVSVCSFSVVTAESPANNKPVPLLSYNGISLPLQHVPYFLNNNKRLAKQCRSDPFCPFKVSPLNTSNKLLVTSYNHFFVRLQQDALQDLSVCWGYEMNCDPEKRFSYPVCIKADSGWYCSLMYSSFFVHL